MKHRKANFTNGRQLKFHQLAAQWNIQPVFMLKQFKIKVYNGNVNKS